MQYRVIGTNQTTRKPMDTVIDAPSLERARMLAEMKKINVTSIEPMEEGAALSATLDYARPKKRSSKLFVVIIVLAAVVAFIAFSFVAGWIEL
ncbi:MAG TPA: hypothetical protein PK402_00720 [Tepidisphaeraceae bacterium]|nr:hypothetical protein [Tepidisphaeraceae bacterium]